MIEDLEHHIRERARSIWEREGRPSDRAEAHWSIAIEELAAEAAPAPAAQPKAPRKVAAAAATAAPKRRSAATRLEEAK